MTTKTLLVLGAALAVSITLFAGTDAVAKAASDCCAALAACCGSASDCCP